MPEKRHALARADFGIPKETWRECTALRGLYTILWFTEFDRAHLGHTGKSIFQDMPVPANQNWNSRYSIFNPQLSQLVFSGRKSLWELRKSTNCSATEMPAELTLFFMTAFPIFNPLLENRAGRQYLTPEPDSWIRRIRFSVENRAGHVGTLASTRILP